MNELLSSLQLGIYAALLVAAFFAFSMFMRLMLTRQKRNALLNLHRELGTLKWIGADSGWDSAITAVRKHILERVGNDEPH